MRVTTSQPKVLASGEGLRLQSGPGRDLIFKVTGEDTGGAFDYFIVEVAPHGGPPLHVHHNQQETIQVLTGRYKIRIGDEIFYLQEGGFAYLPSRVPHAFLNLTDEPGEVVCGLFAWGRAQVLRGIGSDFAWCTCRSRGDRSALRKIRHGPAGTPADP
jgi:quercetin dioxygenase-like cupin family protein